MNYSNIQKIISSFLLFIFFFGQVFGLSFISLFSNSVYADNREFHDLVSIIVTEDIYDKLDNEIDRYAEDIQGYLSNTKVVVLPIKDDTSAFSISSMNERLFYEGYKGLKKDVNFESRLIGTVIIGNVELPVIEDKGKTTKSILPFVDFEDKQFIYNPETKLFEKNKENINGIKAEIFHGMISPNSGNKDKNIELIKDFLDKDHDFYTGKNLFDKNKEVLNGKTGEDINGNYKPYVFYFDGIREQKALSYTAYKGYTAFQDNKEDILYKRYSQKLNDNIQKDVTGAREKEINDVLKGVDDEKIINAFKNNEELDVSGSSDVSLKHIVDASTNIFLEIFNKGTISDFRTNVHNAGRYNDGGAKVNVDMIPYFVSVLDKTTDNIIKLANSDLEGECLSCAKKQKKISGLTVATKVEVVEGLPKSRTQFNKPGQSVDVSNGCSAFLKNDQKLTSANCKFNSSGKNLNQCESVSLSCNIGSEEAKKSSNKEAFTTLSANGNATLLLTKGEFGAILKIGECKFLNGNSQNGDIRLGIKVKGGIKNKLVEYKAFDNILKHYTTTYTNFFYGLQGKDVKKADQCTFYEGSTTNGGTLVESNRGYNVLNTKKDLDKIKNCKGKVPDVFEGYWGKNTPLNLTTKGGLHELKFKAKADPSLAIVPLYDIKGSKKVVNKKCPNGKIEVTSSGGASKSTVSGNGPIPCDCCKTNFLKTRAPVYNPGERPYQVPINGQKAVNWTCKTKNKRYTSIPKSHGTGNFPDIMKAVKVDVGDDLGCLTEGIEVIVENSSGTITQFNKDETDEDKYKSEEGGEGITVAKSKHGGEECRFVKYKYYYKNIPSEMERKSPSKSCMDAQLINQQIPNLPVDRDRSLLFKGCSKGPNGLDGKQEIKYPYLFRAPIGDCNKDGKFSVEKAKGYLGKFLDDYDKKYPKIDFKLKEFLKEKPDFDINIGGEIKTVKYYDFLAFALYWNSLNNVSAKYKFLMNNYLNDQIGGNSYNFVLPKNKKLYEIAYLGNHGDAQNMFIKMNPKENIDTNPYSDIVAKNSLLNSNKISVGVLNGTNKINYNAGGGNNLSSANLGNSLFKCAPPEGVPIRKWIPAVMCRLEGLLPPEISVGAGKCGSSSLFESDDGVNYYHLLDEETKEQDKFCSKNGGIIDYDKNGLNDFCEYKIKNNGKLKLSSESTRLYYNTIGNLNAEVLDKNNKRLLLDNSSYITFNLKKIVDKTDGKVVFDNSKDDFDAKIDIISKYIAFKEVKIKSKFGKVKYSFATKNKIADIYIEANLDLIDSQNNSIKKIKSDPLLIKIRSERLFLSSKKVLENHELDFDRTTRVSDKTNIYLYDKKNKKLDIEGLNTNSIVLGLLNIGADDKNQNINFPINIILRDDKNKILRKEVLNNLNNVKELFSIKKSGNYKIEILDKYDFKVEKNIEVLTLEPSKIKLNLGTTVLEKGGSISTNLVSIYDKFDNIVVGNKYIFDLNILGNSLEFNDNSSKQLKISTYEGYKAFRIKTKNNSGVSKVVVNLYNKENKKLATTSKNIKVLDELKLNINYSDILKVGNNEYEADLEFVDKNNKLISELNSRVYLSAGSEYIELNTAYNNIVNGKTKIKFKTKTLAGEDKILNFRVEGFNTVINKSVNILPEKAFGLSFVNTKTELEASKDTISYINIELRDIYNNLIFTDSSSIINLEVLDKYKDIIKPIDSSKKLYKGKASFKIKATDTIGKAYLKFSINKKLEDNTFIVGEGDKQVKMYGVSDKSIKLETFFFYNKNTLDEVKYNALYTTLLGAEYGDITQKDYLASSILFNKNNRALAVTSLINSPYNKLDAVKISNNGIVFKTFDKTDLTQDVTISLKKDLNNNKYYLDLFNSALNLYIGKIYLNYDKLNINSDIYSQVENSKEINLKEIFGIKNLNVYSALNKVKLNSLLKNNKNSLIVYVTAADYKIRDLYSKNGNSKAIYYIDPFNTKFSLNSFSRYSMDSYDNFEKNKKVGWSAGNKTLLAFTAGESVGDATKQYMGVSGINLGDPIISLKKIKKESNGITKKFDSTIGKKLNNKEIKGYRVFDYNADGLDDILLTEKNGFISLLENTKTTKGFLNQKHLARVIDMGKNEFLSVGDFSGDKFDDIFFVNKKGKPFLLNNNNKNFKRIDLSKNFALKGKIIQAKAFDMDNDKIDDIVTLDDSGEINIFYGNKGSINFTKKNIHSGYGMKLNSGIRNNNGVIYFDGLIQNIQNRQRATDPTKFRNVDLVENLMFEKILYNKNINISNNEETKETLPSQSGVNNENIIQNTNFIKSEFASEVGIKVERTLKDINGGKLTNGDLIQVEVKLKNTTNKIIKHIVYGENVQKYFSLVIDSIKTDKNVNINKNLGIYDFYIDNFNLSANEEIKITYKVKTKALAYGHITVGLYEQDEAGDDEYGDILLASSQYNCGVSSRDIFRSTDKRSYIKGYKTQEPDRSTLPKELKDNNIDNDKNGIPDYIDKLTPKDAANLTKTDKSAMKTCADDARADCAKNNVSKPENDIYGDSKESCSANCKANNISETNPDTGAINDIKGVLNDKTNDLSSDVDDIIEGFSCGFGRTSCISMPINWAPLAPGNDISTPFGLIGDGLKINEGIPVFSALTGIITPIGCVPSIWPISPLSFPTCSGLGAGGYLGINSFTNFFRLFVTPTLTGGVGVAACFGGPARVTGQIPPSIVTPFIPYGNCVVTAAPLAGLCDNEDTDSDPSSQGPVCNVCTAKSKSERDSLAKSGRGYGVINSNCDFDNTHNKLPLSNMIDSSLAKSYLDYRKTGVQNSNLVGLIDDRFAKIENGEVDYGSCLSQNQPIISCNGGSGDESDISINLDYSEDSNGSNFKAVEELQMERIAPFPRFITQWVNDQIEEFITKLADFPTFFIILPDLSKIFDTDWGKYTDDMISGTKKSYQTGGIKEAYEFLGNVPFVRVEGEIVNINIPEIDPESYETAISQWKLALQSYPEQINEAIQTGKYSPESIVSAQAFVKSLEMNIGILETYKDIPGAISKIFNKKQEYLEQIMCNIETIENITGGWLGDNGKRFKAWVELYMLVKAILKSWQVLVDIFIDYDESCHECKNERWDSTQWEWTLISMIVPPIPVIQFPKWPDITLDLHNIRMNLTVKLPEFKVNHRPIVLPPAPLLLLPDYKYIVPKLDTLPLLKIPKLPDIPSIPSVKLPNLPPPPSLPKIWSSIESYLKILKLIVKVMCILKQIPLVPEARVGDHIAYLTEGAGYRGFDFIDKLLPNFSYPYLDEIKVTSYVNLEFETDFITEMARTIVSPINNFTNDFTHIFDKEKNNSGNSNGGGGNSGGGCTSCNKTTYTGDYINSKDFISLVNKELSKNYILKNPRFDELKHSFDVVNNYTYSREDKLIGELKKANYEKFDVLKSIIKREINKTKSFKNNSKDILNNSNLYRKISYTYTDDIKLYNKSLEKYNDAFKKSAKNLINPTYFDTDSIKETGKNILSDIKNTTDNFEKLVETKNKNTFTQNNKYLTAVNTTKAIANTALTNSNIKSKYSRNYKGIYIIQNQNGKRINYNLFDYLDDLNGDEVTTQIDYDLDKDLDLLYFMDGNLYLKENLIFHPKENNHLSGVEVLDSDDNKFINGDIFYEAVNGLTESYVANKYININFIANNRQDISNYRFEYYSIIDKYLNENNEKYIPKNINKNIVDSFSNINNTTIIKTGTGYTIRNNLGHIYEVGNNIVGVNLKTNKLLNLKDSLKNGNIAIIAADTNIYAGGKSVEFKYQVGDDKKVLSISIDKYKNINFDDKIKIISISGDAYIVGDEEMILRGNDIYDYKDMPLLPDSKIYVSREFIKTTSSHIGIKYYDETINDLDFRKTDSYLLYDLGIKAKSYSITLNTDNDYFYSRINVFKNNIFGTKTSQVLLSPQLESDSDAPELDINTKIRIPVYQKKIIEITDSLYENSGFENIKEFKIEGIEDNEYKILKTSDRVRIEFGKFNKIFNKKVKFIITDNNYNTLKKDIELEVYPPIPEISSYTGSIIRGVIDEKLNSEPINLYRYRGGNLKRLETSSGTTRVNTNIGKFNFKLSTIDSDLIDVNINNKKIFNINENTGKIHLLNPLYRIKADINNNHFIEISVLDKDLDKIFSEVIKLNSYNNNIKIVNSFSELKDNGFFVRIVDDNFDYYQIPDSAQFNAGTIVIYRKTDSKKEPLFAILTDGRIKTLNGFYKIEYTTFKDYISLKLIDKHFNKEIGELLLRLDSSYVIK